MQMHLQLIYLISVIHSFFLCLFIFKNERDREGDTESEADSKLQAVSTEPKAGLELTEHEIVT